METPAAQWGDFYVIMGSAAAALTGLQFVVQTLIATLPRGSAGVDPEGGIAAFGTPTVVHFALALLISGIVSAPWHTSAGPGAALAVTGVGGLGYAIIVMRRAQRQRSYRTTTYDWMWHVVFPSVAYVATLLAGAMMAPDREGPLFLLGAATMLLLFVGIHNAWDTVTYLTVAAYRRETAAAAPPQVAADEPAGAP